VGHPYWPAWGAWLIGDGLANLVLAPTFVLWATGGLPGLCVTTRWRVAEVALWCGLFVLMTSLAVSPIWGVAFLRAVIFLPVPLLLWAAVRFGPQGIATSLSLVAVFVVIGVASGNGPFAGQSTPANVLTVQLFLAVIGIPLLFLAALVQEREAARAEAE